MAHQTRNRLCSSRESFVLPGSGPRTGGAHAGTRDGPDHRRERMFMGHVDQPLVSVSSDPPNAATPFSALRKAFVPNESFYARCPVCPPWRRLIVDAHRRGKCGRAGSVRPRRSECLSLRAFGCHDGVRRKWASPHGSGAGRYAVGPRGRQRGGVRGARLRGCRRRGPRRPIPWTWSSPVPIVASSTQRARSRTRSAFHWRR